MINYSVQAQPLGHKVGWLCNFALSIDPNVLGNSSHPCEVFLCLNVNKEDRAVHGTIEIKNVIKRQRDSCLRVDLRPSENWVMMSCCSLGFISQINWRAYLSNIASVYTPVYEESLRIQIFDLLALLPNLRSSKPGNLKVFCLHKG